MSTTVGKLRESLAGAGRRSVTPPELRGHAVLALAEYGRSRDDPTLRQLREIYPVVLRALGSRGGLDIWRDLKPLIERGETTYWSLQPILMFDHDEVVVSTTALDFVAYSTPDAAGLPEGLTRLISIAEKGEANNLGAIFGGLVALGDAQFGETLYDMHMHLIPEELQVAARLPSAYLQHHWVEFWLRLAEDLVSNLYPSAQSVFGSAASAIVLARRKSAGPYVFETKRCYPAHLTSTPVALLRRWELDEYAAHIAPRLFSLAEAEADPTIFDAVANEWGLVASHAGETRSA